MRNKTRQRSSACNDENYVNAYAVIFYLRGCSSPNGTLTNRDRRDYPFEHWFATFFAFC